MLFSTIYYRLYTGGRPENNYQYIYKNTNDIVKILKRI